MCSNYGQLSHICVEVIQQNEMIIKVLTEATSSLRAVIKIKMRHVTNHICSFLVFLLVDFHIYMDKAQEFYYVVTCILFNIFCLARDT